MADTAKKKGVLDRISSLPDPIICHILSFLPTIDTVRTSILSSRWRYLFSSMSTLDFDHYSNPPNRKNMIHFKNFVDRFFFQPSKINLECFKVHDSWIEDYVTVNNRLIEVPFRDDDYLRISGWICAAVWRGVKKIDIEMRRDNALELPAHLFACQSLTTVNLCRIGVMNVPTNLCLPNLKTLRLKNLEFKEGCSIHRLISSCPVLEDLVIIECYSVDTSELNIHNVSLKRLVLDYSETLGNGTGDDDYVINAPSLVYFQYIAEVGNGYTLRNMDSLEMADVRIDPLFEVGRERSAAQLFQGIRNVKSLHLTINNGLETLPQRLLDKRIAFHNLVELIFWSWRDKWKGRWLLNFLRCVPNLKTLTVQYMNGGRERRGLKDLPEEDKICILF